MIAEEIKKLRGKLKFTQRELAVALKVDTITVSRWERDESRPRKKHIRMLERLKRRFD